VSVGDRTDDGQTKPMPPVLPNSRGAELPEWLEQVLDRVRGGISVPVLVTVMAAPSLVVAVEIATWPPGTLCRMAFSMRLAIRQRRDEALLPVPQFHELLAGRPQSFHGGFGIGDRDLEQGPPGGQRGAQLVRGVRDEAALRIERLLQAPEQAIDGGAELGELVAAATQRQPPVQVARGYVPGRGDDRAQRPDEPAYTALALAAAMWLIRRRDAA
jgi:hypothetical protein